MRVDVPDAKGERRVLVDEMQNLVICGDRHPRQVRQRTENKITLPQIPQRKFADHEGMHHNLTPLEKIAEGFVAGTQMVDPNGSIDQDHAFSDRRRRTGLRSGSLPPKRAKRRAASRSINAFSASRINLDFSFRPVQA
jgi:hypothetical protein